MNGNPYDAPESGISGPPLSPAEAERIRLEHGPTEAAIILAGAIYYFLGGACLVTALLIFANQRELTPLYGMPPLAIGISLGALGFLICIAASAVRKFRPWSRVAITIISGAGLLAFPFWTVINGYILYLAFGKKGRMIFSPRYREIIAATPQVKIHSAIFGP